MNGETDEIVFGAGVWNWVCILGPHAYIPGDLENPEEAHTSEH